MKKIVFTLFITALLFSTMEVALKLAVVGLDAFQLTLLRFLLGGAVLLPFVIRELKRRKLKLTGGDWSYLLILGVINIVISMSCFQFAINYTKASTVAILFSVNPVFTMLFAHFMTDEKMNKNKILSFGVSMIGLVIILNPFNLSMVDLTGMILAVFSAFTFGFYSAFSKLKMERLGGLIETGISFITGSGVMALLMVIMKKPIISGIAVDALPILLYVGIIGTGIGYLLYFTIIEKTNTATASIIFFIKPALAPIIAMLILHENITINVFIGIIFIIVGSFMNLNKSAIKEKLT